MTTFPGFVPNFLKIRRSMTVKSSEPLLNFGQDLVISTDFYESLKKSGIEVNSLRGISIAFSKISKR